MTLHTLKTDPQVFEASWNGEKDFEIRLNDRSYQVGDELCLRETVHSGAEIKTGQPLRYTSRALMATVCFVLQGGYGLVDGWVILQLCQIMQCNIGAPDAEV